MIADYSLTRVERESLLVQPDEITAPLFPEEDVAQVDQLLSDVDSTEADLPASIGLGLDDPVDEEDLMAFVQETKGRLVSDKFEFNDVDYGEEIDETPESEERNKKNLVESTIKAAGAKFQQQDVRSDPRNMPNSGAPQQPRNQFDSQSAVQDLRPGEPGHALERPVPAAEAIEEPHHFTKAMQRARALPVNEIDSPAPTVMPETPFDEDFTGAVQEQTASQWEEESVAGSPTVADPADDHKSNGSLSARSERTHKAEIPAVAVTNIETKKPDRNPTLKLQLATTLVSTLALAAAGSSAWMVYQQGEQLSQLHYELRQVRGAAGQVAQKVDMERVLKEIRQLKAKIGGLSETVVALKQTNQKSLSRVDTSDEQRIQTLADKLNKLSSEIKGLMTQRAVAPTANGTVSQRPTMEKKTETVDAAPTEPVFRSPWVISLVSFVNETVADQELARLQAMGVTNVVKQAATVREKIWYRLLATGYSSRKAAQAATPQIRKLTGLDKLWVKRY